MALSEREPVRWAGAVQALIPLIASGLALFDVWHPTQEQVAWLGLMYAGIVGAITSIVRGTVWSPAGHEAEVARKVAEAKVEVALAAPPPAELPPLAPPALATPLPEIITAIPPPIHPTFGAIGGRSGPGTEGNA